MATPSESPSRLAIVVPLKGFATAKDRLSGALSPAEREALALRLATRVLTVARTIVLPLMLPAILAGALLAFVSSVGNFGTPALMGIPVGYNTLVTLIYQRLAGFGPSVLAQAATLSALIGLFALVVLRLHARLRKATDANSFNTCTLMVPPSARRDSARSAFAASADSR